MTNKITEDAIEQFAIKRLQAEGYRCRLRRRWRFGRLVISFARYRPRQRRFSLKEVKQQNE
ncbi:MAG: hypothetical protein IAE79_09975 [Anaerolinea sp.]|nr:hypothetical protein [Anaerolinea sp.]